jgi:hypothetical protein
MQLPLRSEALRGLPGIVGSIGQSLSGTNF